MVCRKLFLLLFSLACAASISATASAEPKVVATIKPVHSLAAAIMKGVGEPHLMIKGSASPHTYSLKPSDATALQEADLVVWVGPALEQFMEKSVETIASNATKVTLIDVDEMLLLPFRDEETFETSAKAHDHDEHDHAHKDDHDHKHEDEHAHEDDHGHEHEEHAHEEDHGHHGHDHAGGMDPHIWLNPDNAKLIADTIRNALAELDPENVALYEANTDALKVEIQAAADEATTLTKGLNEAKYVVFHDAYQYFEKGYDIAAPVGAIHINPENAASAQRLSSLQEKVVSEGAVCVFSEPQFDPRLSRVVTEGTDISTGTLDPLGAQLDPGADLYPKLILAMANAFRDCLKPTN